MNEHSKADPTYVVGHSQKETQWLQKQGDLVSPATGFLLQRAGIVAGMKVLDVGSGAGDVALLAAELVGPTGVVVGVDSNPTILETARVRVRAAGLTQVSFMAGDIRNVALDRDFDAVIGRNVLMYVADLADVLRGVVRYLRPGGIVAFHEFDFSILERLVETEGVPALFQQVSHWCSAGFRRAGVHMQMGFELPKAFVAAGLPFPQMQLDGVIGTGPEWAGYDVLANLLRTLLPMLVQYGIVQVEEVDVDTLSERMRAEAVKQQIFIASHIQVGAWACAS